MINAHSKNLFSGSFAYDGTCRNFTKLKWDRKGTLVANATESNGYVSGYK